MAGSVVAIAAAAASRDSFWLIKVKDEECVYANPVTDDYGHIIPAGFLFYSGNFLEETHLKGHTYKLSKKLTFFNKESVVLPHAQIKDKKNGIAVSDEDYVDILCHFEKMGISAY